MYDFTTKIIKRKSFLLMWHIIIWKNMAYKQTHIWGFAIPLEEVQCFYARCYVGKSFKEYNWECPLTIYEEDE